MNAKNNQSALKQLLAGVFSAALALNPLFGEYQANQAILNLGQIFDGREGGTASPVAPLLLAQNLTNSFNWQSPSRGPVAVPPKPLLLASSQNYFPSFGQASQRVGPVAVPLTNADVSNYAGHLSQIRTNMVWAARQLRHTPYVLGGRSEHGLDCSGVLHLVIFEGDRNNSADGYYQLAVKSEAITQNPQPGDVFFLDWASNPAFKNNENVDTGSGPNGIDHTGLVDTCGYFNDGTKFCNIIHAAGDDVHFSKIVQNQNGAWGYYIDPNRAYGPNGRPSNNPNNLYGIRADNLNFQFADSLKMRGLPGVEEVSHGQAIGRSADGFGQKLGGVDLAAPFPLDGQALGLGSLEAIRLSPDGQSLTLYATPSQPGVELHGVNPSDVLTILQSYARTGQPPSFTLLPDQQSSRQIQQALDSASAALNAMGPLAPGRTGKILYGRQVWDYLGISNPSSFSMNAIFSDSGLRSTHAGEVLMASDLLLKTLALGHPDDSSLTPFLARAAQMAKNGNNAGSLETSRLWFEADPSSFHVNTVKEFDGSIIWEFEPPKIRVSCRPIQYGGIGGVQDTAGSCAEGSLSAWYAEYLTNNIDSLSQQYPVLKELRELYKASSVARLLHQKGVKPPVSDNSAANHSWATPSGADFLPVLYVSRPDSHNRVSMLMAVGGGGVDLTTPFNPAYLPGLSGPSYERYSYQPSAPLGDAPDGRTRAVRFNLTGTQVTSFSPAFNVPPVEPIAPVVNRPSDQTAPSNPSFLKTLARYSLPFAAAVTAGIAIMGKGKALGAATGIIAAFVAGGGAKQIEKAPLIAIPAFSLVMGVASSFAGVSFWRGGAVGLAATGAVYLAQKLFD